MVDKLTQSEVVARRTAYLNDLYTKAVNGDVEARGKLSKIAFGGFPMAQDLVKKMDEELAGVHSIKTATGTNIT